MYTSMKQKTKLQIYSRSATQNEKQTLDPPALNKFYEENINYEMNKTIESVYLSIMNKKK